MNEKTKKWLKITGIVIGVLLLYGVFNLFFGGVSQKAGHSFKEKSGGLSQKIDSSKAPGLGISGSKLGSRISAPATGESGIKNLAESEKISGGDKESQDKRVIKNGNLSLKVAKTEESAKKISEIAKSKGGEVFSSSFYEKVKGSKSGTMTVKVPVNRFEEAIEEIKKVATQVVSESTTGKDVTETFVKILDRAGKIEEVLKVTKEISRVRGEIERLEGRIKYLESQTDMSTISVDLSEDIEITPVGEDWRPWQVVKKSVKTLVKNTQGFADNLIYFVIVKIPSIIIFLLILWIVYWIGKRAYQKVKS